MGLPTSSPGQLPADLTPSPEVEAQAESEIGGGVGPPSRGHRNPRLDQLKRTWYFLRRNTLAVVGLGILIMLAGIAVYATTTPIPWDQSTNSAATTNPLVT